MYDDAPFDKKKTLGWLRERSVVKAVVAYSGGNDEGGVESITLTVALANGSTEERQFEPYVGSGYRYERGEWRQIEPPTDDDSILAQQLGAPVYERYGGFAGDFSVNGHVVFDVAASTVKIEEDYEVPRSDYRELEI
jgi:hypothetical protein